jgi:hypothetical protein
MNNRKINKTLSKLKPIAGILAVRAVSKNITDRFISAQINKKLDEAKTVIAAWYADFLMNVYFYAGINAAIVLLTLIPYFFFSINDTIIAIISAMSIIIVARLIYQTIKNLVKIRPYIGDISVFLTGLRDCKSLPVAIREFIRYKFQELYFENTNKAGRIAHSIFGGLGFIKTSDDIEDEVVDDFYHLIKNLLIKDIVYKTAAIIVFYAVFVFLLKPFVFSYAMEMNIVQVLLYPFTVAIPKVIMIFKGIP